MAIFFIAGVSLFLLIPTFIASVMLERRGSGWLSQPNPPHLKPDRAPTSPEQEDLIIPALEESCS